MESLWLRFRLGGFEVPVVNEYLGLGNWNLGGGKWYLRPEVPFVHENLEVEVRFEGGEVPVGWMEVPIELAEVPVE